MSSSDGPHAAPRRSTRVRAQIPVRITSQDPAFEFSEACHTLVVNTEGCGVRLTRPLDAGLPVSVSDLPDGGSARARVANRTGRARQHLVHPAGASRLGSAGCV